MGNERLALDSKHLGLLSQGCCCRIHLINQSTKFVLTFRTPRSL